MSNTIETGGLVGALKKMAAGTADRANKGGIADPLRWIVRLVLLAGFVLVLKKARANPDPTDAIVVLALGCAALMAEYYMGGEMVRAWVDRAVTKLLAAAAVYVAVLGYAALQWTGTAADMEATKTGAQKAAYVAQEDSGNTIAELTKRNNDLLQRIDMAPKRTPEAAAIAIRNAKANRFWDMTDGCTKTSGPQTRKFCDEYASAVADEAGGKQLIVDREEQKIIAAKLQKARAERKETAVVVTAERSDLRFLTHYAGLTEQAAADFSAAWKIVIISFLACILGMMIKARELRDVPRKPWGFVAALSGLLKALKAALFGKTHTFGTVQKMDGIVGVRNPETLEVIGRKVQTA